MSALKSSLALVPHNNSNKLKWAQLTFLAGDFDAARDLLLQLSKMRLSADEKQLLIALLSDQRLSQHEPLAGVDKQ